MISSEIFCWCRRQIVDGAAAVGRRQHVIAEPQQHLLDQLALLLVVFRPAGWSRCPPALVRRRRRRRTVSRASGSEIVNTVPFPSSLCTWMSPPDCLTIP